MLDEIRVKKAAQHNLKSIDVTLPRNRLIVVTGTIGVMQGFQGILILTRGGPGYATMVPAMRMYDTVMPEGSGGVGSAPQMGFGSAIGVFLFIIIGAVTLLNLRLIRSVEPEVARRVGPLEVEETRPLDNARSIDAIARRLTELLDTGETRFVAAGGDRSDRIRRGGGFVKNLPDCLAHFLPPLRRPLLRPARLGAVGLVRDLCDAQNFAGRRHHRRARALRADINAKEDVICLHHGS